MPEPAQTQECSKCKQAVPKPDFPMHRLQEEVAELPDKLEAIRNSIVEVVDSSAATLKAALPPAQDIGKALEPLRKALERLDATPSPEDMKEHIKGCKGCEAKWGPVFAPPQAATPAKVEEPAKAPAPSRPTRATFPSLPINPIKARAYGIEAVDEGEAIAIRTKSQEATEVVPIAGCRWVKDEDGWHYACKES